MKIKVGDTVRYLSAVGGGTVTRIEGKIAYVDDQGFENPVLATDLVVVMPAGTSPDASAKGPKLMFDQSVRDAATTRPAEPEPAPKAVVAPAAEVVETPHGDKLNIVLAFEPSSTKQFSEASFNAVLVNDSNYWLDFCVSRRGDGEHQWTVIYTGTVAPNELIDLQSFSRTELPQIERVALQAIAFKKDKPFELKPAINITRRLDLTKFHKFHCFRPGIYFDTPVLELPLIKDDLEPRQTISSAVTGKEDAAKRLAEKFRVDSPPRKHKKDPAANPHKLLPLIEVDLHIGELIDTTAGMDNTAIIQRQLDEVRRHMRDHSRRIGQKIVFIHGKGDGVLRKEVLALLRREFPKATTQDASFQEYGFGATLVTIH